MDISNFFFASSVLPASGSVPPLMLNVEHCYEQAAAHNVPGTADCLDDDRHSLGS